jgi:hypothetical protein
MCVQAGAMTPQDHLANLPDARLASMAHAGTEIVRCIEELGASASNLVLDLLRDADAFLEWNHYPDGDVYDEHSACQYYFHAHAPDGREQADFGHFHTFMDIRETHRLKPGCVSQPQLTHLVGISMTPSGFPVRLFTTNRWVTGEAWRKAADIIPKIDRFAIRRFIDSPVDRWLTAMFVLFRPQIEQLLMDRELLLQGWQSTHPGEDAFEDTRLELMSSLDISLFEQIEALDRELDRRAAILPVSKNDGTRRQARLNSTPTSRFIERRS